MICIIIASNPAPPPFFFFFFFGGGGGGGGGGAWYTLRKGHIIQKETQLLIKYLISSSRSFIAL